MDPILTVLRIGDAERAFGTYGLMLMFAIVVGVTLATRAASRARLDVGAVIAAAGFTVAGAMFGSWSLFVLVEWIRTGEPMQAIQSGGLVFYGAPIGGAAAYAFAARVLHLPAWRLLDLAVPAIPAAHALGRIGCFLGGCCFGLPWDGPWAVHYRHPAAPASFPGLFRHPVPLYESAALLVLAFVLLLWPKRKTGDGRWVGVYLVSYAVIRSVVETLRGDQVRGLVGGVISTSQLISIAMASVGGWLIWRARRRAARMDA
ncbi:MAG: prolipoprotein diacylglyceryl transferase [Deltaproteobacteria bacterium]|nr:prolipoprotein diacylglyceryl transferase [Deltaproteobacteria bacterium]